MPVPATKRKPSGWSFRRPSTSTWLTETLRAVVRNGREHGLAVSPRTAVTWMYACCRRFRYFGVPPSAIDACVVSAASRSLRSRGQRRHPHQGALRTLSRQGLDLSFVAADFILNGDAYREVGRLHFLVLVGAAGIFVR